MGTANPRPSGSIWVACALSASSRASNQSAHSTRVVSRAASSGLSSQVASQSAERRLDALGQARLVQRLEPGLVEGQVVVELGRLPRLARAGELLGVARRLERAHRDLVRLDVVGVRVAAVLVVRRDHVRPELPHQAHERLGGLVERHEREAALGQRRERRRARRPRGDRSRRSPARSAPPRGSPAARAISARRTAARSASTAASSRGAGLRTSPRSPPVHVTTRTSMPSAT